ncbi:MAG: hypothetical protein KAG97_11375 [Victivallales bacterium]|nr:hypothetical protein [Victivallales bacterium]
MKELLRRIDDFKVSMEDRLAAAAEIAERFEPDLEPAVCEVDLHCHSFCSDGYYSPSNKVFEAFRRGIRVLSIADHDIFDGQIEALRAGEIFGVEIIPAIEFYTSRPGIEVIGHFPDVPAFLDLLRSGKPDVLIEAVRKAKKRQLAAIVAKIPECFAKLVVRAEITPEDVDSFVRNGLSTKGDVSVVIWQKYGCELSAKGLCGDVKEFHSKYTANPEMLDEPMEIDIDLLPEAFVKRIREWGGLPGLPHPGELRKKEGLGNCELRETIERLGVVGLQTIEVDGFRNGICTESGLSQTTVFESMRLDYNDNHPDRPPLLFTNGSDDHNQPGEGLELGCGQNRNLSPEFGKYENVERLRRRAAEF